MTRSGKRIPKLDKARDRDLLPKLGATDYIVDQGALQALPQGRNTPSRQGVAADTGRLLRLAISNPDFHVRNEYANVQYRINGIQLRTACRP